MSPLFDRRRSIGALGVFGATLLTGGCARGSVNPTPSGVAGQPKKGGRLRVAFSGAGITESLDPRLNSMYLDGARGKAMFDKLLAFGGDMAPVGRLAEHWEAGPDQQVWRFRLRQAEFHDGRPVKASDALDSIAAVLSTPKAVAAQQYRGIDLRASRAVEDRTLEIRLRTPNSEFPDVMCSYGTEVMPGGKMDPAKPVGSGPFQFVAHRPGETTLLSRFDNYWEGPAHFDELEFIVANDAGARIQALGAGQVDYVDDVSLTSARTMDRRSDMRIYRLPLGSHRSFVMKCDRPPFNNPDVRMAMKLLADRNELRRAVLHDTGRLGNDLFGGPGQHYFAADLPQREMDRERARSLLRKAGAEGLAFTLDTSDSSSGMKEAAISLADQAAQVGVKVSINLLGKENYWSETLEKGVMSSYGGGAMPIGQHFATRTISAATNNYSRWNNAEVDELYRKVLQTSDEDQRGKLYHRMQELHHAEGGHLVWGIGDYLVAASAKVAGIDAAAPTNSLQWSRFDRVWLNS